MACHFGADPGRRSRPAKEWRVVLQPLQPPPPQPAPLIKAPKPRPPRLAHHHVVHHAKKVAAGRVRVAAYSP